jgi:hypothetical protein
MPYSIAEMCTLQTDKPTESSCPIESRSASYIGTQKCLGGKKYCMSDLCTLLTRGLLYHIVQLHVTHLVISGRSRLPRTPNYTCLSWWSLGKCNALDFYDPFSLLSSRGCCCLTMPCIETLHCIDYWCGCCVQSYVMELCGGCRGGTCAISKQRTWFTFSEARIKSGCYRKIYFPTLNVYRMCKQDIHTVYLLNSESLTK